MEKIKNISQLLAGKARLAELGRSVRARALLVDEIRGYLPERLAQNVVSAGLDNGCLTIGVAGAAWAMRIRYSAEAARANLSDKLRTRLSVVRVRVVRAAPGR